MFNQKIKFNTLSVYHSRRDEDISGPSDSSCLRQPLTGKTDDISLFPIIPEKQGAGCLRSLICRCTSTNLPSKRDCKWRHIGFPLTSFKPRCSAGLSQRSFWRSLSRWHQEESSLLDMWYSFLVFYNTCYVAGCGKARFFTSASFVFHMLQIRATDGKDGRIDPSAFTSGALFLSKMSRIPYPNHITVHLKWVWLSTSSTDCFSSFMTSWEQYTFFIHLLFHPFILRSVTSSSSLGRI